MQNTSNVLAVKINVFVKNANLELHHMQGSNHLIQSCPGLLFSKVEGLKKHGRDALSGQ